MEFSSTSLPVDLPWLELCIAAFCIILVSRLARLFLYQDEEAPIPYVVPLPEQAKPGWTGEVLEQPSIKVPRFVPMPSHRDVEPNALQIPGSSAIQCYNPATGQLLGYVNPATPDGIDRAVVKAAEAQKEWSKTTFKQRRKVLRTMLKYVDHWSSGSEDVQLMICRHLAGSFWTIKRTSPP